MIAIDQMRVAIACVCRIMTSLSTAQLKSYPNKAHLSIIINHFDEIAKVLICGRLVDVENKLDERNSNN